MARDTDAPPDRGLRFSRTVTLGELIAAVLMFATLATFYARLEAQIAVIDVRVLTLWHWAGF